MNFTLFSADITGNAGNCSYPHRIEVTDAETLRQAVCHDYVCAEYMNNYRSGSNFLHADCLPFDCDNDHSEDPSAWVTPADVASNFPNVSFAVHYSRSNMKEKNGRAARPKFHVLFPVKDISDPSAYTELKKLVSFLFPYFDDNALDAARFFFGTSEAEVELHEGSMNLSEFLNEDEFDSDLPDARSESKVIHEGCRNSSISRFAARVLKKYGDADEAYSAFIEEAEKCSPPLDDSELNSIWLSAKRFYQRIKNDPAYVPPEEYNDPSSYKPDDYSDVGQAKVLAKYFSNCLRYSPATHFLRYNDKYWEETEPGAQAVAHELTRRQLIESEQDITDAFHRLQESGGQKVLESSGKGKAENLMNKEQLKAYQDLQEGNIYRKFVISRRMSKNITNTLHESHPMLEISPDDLDSDYFLLNTPNAAYDLQKGLAGARAHSPDDFCTKMTSVSPGTRGEQLWQDFLSLVFCQNDELIEYVQLICGIAAIGTIKLEALIIAYGNGKNGKSTFFNTISRVLGLYSGNISADALTVNCKRNVKPELAEAKGKRLLIAAELQEGMRLSESIIKQLCSTDDIYAEKKYKDPFSFKPSHTLVLYTNHLPKVSATDDGTWRRLIVIPFDAKISSTADIKNYSDYLYENAGEAVLAWIIEGARKAIELEFKFPAPECVQNAIDEYRAANNWFAHFIDDKCEVGEELKESSSALYQSYRYYCINTNEYIRNTADFYAALDKAGFHKFRFKGKFCYKGIKLKASDSEFEDFLD